MAGLSLLDGFTALLGFIGVVLVLRPGRELRWGYAAVALPLVGWQIWFRGLHWQMFPAWLVVAGCAALLFRPRRAGQRWAAGLGASVAIALCAGSLVMSWVLPEFSLPAPTGPYAVGTRLEHWADPATGRELAVQIWYPAVPGPRARLARYARLGELRPRFVYEHWIRTNSSQDAPVAAAARFPVLLFGHRWGGVRTQDTFLTEDLASHGYIVVAADHPGNTERTENADGSVFRSDRADALSDVEVTGVDGVRRLWSRELAAWTADNEFVLDRLASGAPAWLAGRADLTRVGALGHSFGGAAGMNLLGRDPRVRSAVNLDGWTFSGLDARTTEPVMFVYGVPPTGEPGALPAGTSAADQLERDDQAKVRRSLARWGGYRLYVLGTQHADFTDETLLSPIQRLTYTGPLPGRCAREITRGLVLGFFDQTLRGDGALPVYPEVK